MFEGVTVWGLSTKRIIPKISVEYRVCRKSDEVTDGFNNQ